MYLRYSSSVVAPMHWSSPRASGGLRMLAASMAPSAAPAPTSVCSSSMNRTASLVLRSSSMIFLSRSSNSPRYFVPAPATRCRGQDALVEQRLGDVAGDDPVGQPSAMAVLPTPGSPIRAGLFFVFGQDLDDPLDLLLAPMTGIQLARAGGLGEVDAELVDGRVFARPLRLLAWAGGQTLRQDPDDLVADLVEVDAERLRGRRRRCPRPRGRGRAGAPCRCSCGRGGAPRRSRAR